MAVRRKLHLETKDLSGSGKQRSYIMTNDIRTGDSHGLKDKDQQMKAGLLSQKILK